MKIYYICAALIFIFAYAFFHFVFRSGGDGQLYKINDRIAFELQTADENFNGITIRSFRTTNAFVKFVCGACEVDRRGAVEMVNVTYRSGDFIYTDYAQHEIAKTDIVNLRTGETIEARIPADFKPGDDLSKISEYETRGLVRTDENKLTQEYVKANFAPLSTFTNRCLYAHVFFIVGALFLAFPKLLIRLIDVFVKSNDPHDPVNYHRGSGD